MINLLHDTPLNTIGFFPLYISQALGAASDPNPTPTRFSIKGRLLAYITEKPMGTLALGTAGSR